MSILDVVIHDGIVVDGLGGPPRAADVGIDDGRVAAVGAGLGRARRAIAADGRFVVPGFIDVHTHTDFTVLLRPGAEAKLRQGVTTDVTGNCGFSPFPLPDSDAARRHGQFFEPGLTERWTSLAGYAWALHDARPAINVAPLLGLGAVRVAVLEDDPRPAGDAALAAMRDLVAGAMREGAFGVSSGLVYAPGCYADVDELAALARVAADAGGFYATHMRNEGDRLEEAVEEALAVGRRAGCPVQISHHKAIGRANHGRVRSTLARIDEANRAGADVTLDAYPYVAGSSTLASVVPPRFQAGGVDALRERLADAATRAEIARAVRDEGAFALEDIVLAYVPSRPSLAGRRLVAAAAEEGVAPEDLALELIRRDGVGVVMVAFGMDEQDVRTVLAHPRCMVGSDGWVLADDAEPHPHPRNLSCTAHLLAGYVRDEPVLTLQAAVAKLTALPAERLGLADRGRLVPGAIADVAVLDLDGLEDRATFAAPNRYPVGVGSVLVAGRVALEDGDVTDERAGRVLARPGSDAART